MKANEIQQPTTSLAATPAAETPQSAAELFRGRLNKASHESDSAQRSQALSQVLELSIQQTERYRLEMQKRSEVGYENGKLIAHSLEGLIAIGKWLASAAGEIVPERFRGKPGDCSICHYLGQRLGCDTLMLMWNLYVVKGKPGIEGKMYAALLNSSPEVEGRVWYEHTGSGDDRACLASAKDKYGKVHSARVDVKMAKGEGWWESNSKWRSLTDLMLQ
jgi:hypothetical protein